MDLFLSSDKGWETSGSLGILKKETDRISEAYLILFFLECQVMTASVVRVLGYRSGGLGSIPGTTIKKVVGLERGPLSLVSTTEEILDRKVAPPV
jgi:hypothetical protein